MEPICDKLDFVVPLSIKGVGVFQIEDMSLFNMMEIVKKRYEGNFRIIVLASVDFYTILFVSTNNLVILNL